MINGDAIKEIMLQKEVRNKGQQHLVLEQLEWDPITMERAQQGEYWERQRCWSQMIMQYIALCHMIDSKRIQVVIQPYLIYERTILCLLLEFKRGMLSMQFPSVDQSCRVPNGVLVRWTSGVKQERNEQQFTCQTKSNVVSPQLQNPISDKLSNNNEYTTWSLIL